jgi:secreted Zn-dependent insulinase-like peptidase
MTIDFIGELNLRKCKRSIADTSDPIDRLIMLPNGMEALLIHDATTDRSSASMDVRVGHLNDPEDLQGLAHFCEHLMFMGTEKVSIMTNCKRRDSPDPPSQR